MGRAQCLPAQGGGLRGKEGAAPQGSKATSPPSQHGPPLLQELGKLAQEENGKGYGLAFWGIFPPERGRGVVILV